MITEGCSARDKYDRAIEYLTKHPEDLFMSWLFPERNTAGCLFAMASKTGGNVPGVGCLTTIKNGTDYDGVDRVVEGRPDLTQRIRDDPRIPVTSSSARRDKFSIPAESYLALAEWQRILDKELGRV